MRIHTDKLTRADLYAHVPAGCELEVMEKGSRKRARAFDVRMHAWERDADAHGIKRVYTTNSGSYGADRGNPAATYIEWGDWMAALLKIDPAAVIGYYDGAQGFIDATQHQAPTRPKRENAQTHADRWKAELTTARLEYLRAEIRAERISYAELAELQDLADRIEPGDVELLEWAGIPEKLT